MSEPPQLATLEAEEQQLYFKAPVHADTNGLKIPKESLHPQKPKMRPHDSQTKTISSL